MKTSQTIRSEFIAFFEAKGHRHVRSSPVVPLDDPTLLFSNAGMNQFKDVFLGTGTRDYSRAVNAQKCIRASGKHNDLEDVGRDTYHHTFFEMLGNWSFGDYFKRDAIAWAWELLVERWGLPVERLYATVFGGAPQEGLEPDLEAEAIWRDVTPLPKTRVLRFGRKENFWEMGETGPCGPCSEIHMDMGEGTCPRAGQDGHVCGVNAEGCWRYIELWNLVFVQFDRQADGKLVSLPARHVDTGMGLERITRVLQGKLSNYESDLFTPILAEIASVTGVADGPGETGVAFRVIADHLRALTFAIADGALPSNEGRGYVLRRMLRRAARFGRVLGMREPFIHRLVAVVERELGGFYPELRAQAQHVARVIRAEEESFAQTLDRGLDVFAQAAASLAVQKSGTLPGAAVFKLYDTYGFPVDLTRLMAGERGLRVDMAGFEALMEQQRAQARAASQLMAAQTGWVTLSEGADSRFEGYGSLTLESVVRRYARTAEGTLLLVLDRTPFYPEGGGQVGDQGRIHGPAGAWRVVDVRKEGDRIVHHAQGPATPDGRPVTAEVDGALRARTTLNHTATHLLQAALREVLGAHVNQAGSVVHPDYLRFDYTHFEKPSEAQLDEVERLVNREIRRNTPLEIFQSGYQQAIDAGVVALFGEKYGEQVRVVKVPGFSAELCGGCHVRATGDIGLLTIVGESSIAAGVRRILAYTGESAERHLREQVRLVERLRQTLNVAPEQVAARVEHLLDERRTLERELKALKKSSQAQGAGELLKKAQQVDGIAVVADQVEAESLDELRGLADSLRKQLKNGVAVLGSVIQGKASLLCVVGEELVRRNIKAGEIVNRVAMLAEGRGGGPPHMATAGAKDPGKLPHALHEAPRIIHTYLSQVSS
ncbi:MAG: alanine--tRNA ligase [Candidatus Lambdaproteobacteria bacterium]|nr:alanine--tRNA ligase [Candidatus Lambdaproteobacteria bacterium]